MLRKSLQLTVKNLRGIPRVTSNDSCLSIQMQKYSRFAQRHPAAIVNEDDLFNVEIKNTTPPRVQRKPKSRSKNLFSDIKDENIKIRRELETQNIEKENMKILKEVQASTKKNKVKSNEERKNKAENEKESLPKNVFTKVQENEKLVSSVMMSLLSKKKRKKNEQILIEGTRFIQDAIEAKVIPETIIFSRYDDIKDMPFSEKTTKLYKVTYRTIQLWSKLSTAPGVIGIFKKPEPLKVSKKSLPITIICDNIRDPGNMGSILRAAAGVGCEKILLTKGCVDFWDSKVLRSAAGAHFRIPIFGSQEWDDIKDSISADARVYIADNNVESFADEYIETVEEIPNEETDKNLSKRKSPQDEIRNAEIARIKMHNLPVIPYFSADYTSHEVVLIVGGETIGLSNESFNLVEERQGVRVNIPLINKIDSLNAGMALGIVAFEVKRQFLLVQNKLNQLGQ